MQDYGVAHFWIQGDWVTRAVALMLMAMSMMSWTVIAVKGWNIVVLNSLAKGAEKAFWQSSDVQEGLEKLELGTKGGGPFLALARAGHNAAIHHRQTSTQLRDRLDVSDWITRCLKDAMDDSIATLQRGLAVLASIGSTAPFVGLFGTVWGIYHALLTIGETGQTSIGAVAGPVGEALIMTAFGLFVAIPAVLGYNALARANRSIANRLNRFSHALHAFFVTGERLSPTQDSLRAARTES